MSNQHYTPNPFQGPAPRPARKQKRFGFLALGVAAGAALFVGSCSGVLAAGGGSTTAEPGATVTVTAPAEPGPTVTVTAKPEAEPKKAEPTKEAEPEPEPTQTAEPSKKDWKIKIKVLEKTCFGSAGCSVTYRIDPEFVGDRSAYPNEGVVEVSYEVRGDESGPQVGTFEVDLSTSKATYDSKSFASTPSSGTKLKAKVTDVEIREW
jgi:hypothetical protein